MSQGVVMTRSRKTVSSLTRPPVFCNRLVKVSISGKSKQSSFDGSQSKTPLLAGRALLFRADEPRYCVLSVVTMPVGPAFSALAFLVAMVLSTQSSAVFKSALRSSG